MQNLVRSKTTGATGNGGRGTAGAGPGRDLLQGSQAVFPSDPNVLICDGHSSHMTNEFVIFCPEMGVVLVLRPPYTTAALQGEDRRSVRLIKGGWRVARHKKLAELIAKGIYHMGCDHLCNCPCALWQEGFSIANNHRAWQSIGVVPFACKVYLELVEKERAWDKACAKVDLDASKLNVQDMVQTMF